MKTQGSIIDISLSSSLNTYYVNETEDAWKFIGGESGYDRKMVTSCGLNRYVLFATWESYYEYYDYDTDDYYTSDRTYHLDYVVHQAAYSWPESVSKYTDTIGGIANTSGSDGDIIDVWIPTTVQ